jgi:hypothetical protein
MKFTTCFLALAVSCQVCAPVWAQDDSANNGDIRVLLRTLQSRLQDLDDGAQQDKRVTRIGSSRKAVLEEPRLAVRIYDASDLFVVAPSYIAKHESDLSAKQQPLFPAVYSDGDASGSGFGGGGFGGGGGGFNIGSEPPRIKSPAAKTLHQAGGAGKITNVAAPIDLRAARVTLDDVINAITSTISPASWDEVGGEGSIATIGSSLLISQTEDIHEQIASLMNLFRERWGSLRTVSIQAEWLWLTEQELNGLLAKDAKAFGLVDREAWLELHEAPPRENAKAGYSATITCQNGQTVHTLSGGQTLAVTGMIPVVGGTEKSVGYQPFVAMIQEGAALQVTPISNRSGKFITLDAHSRVTLVQPVEREPAEVDHEVKALVSAIDRPEVLTHRLSTTLRVPVGHPMLIGGMTFDGKPQAGEPNLYLFVTVAIQELRDDLDDEEAAPEEAANDIE